MYTGLVWPVAFITSKYISPADLVRCGLPSIIPSIGAQGSGPQFTEECDAVT